jgi:malate dehydrogenase
MKAVVLGASGGIGQVSEYAIDSYKVDHDTDLHQKPLSLLCKLSPHIDELSLYDVVNTPGVTADLSHISSVAVRPPGNIY